MVTNLYAAMYGSEYASYLLSPTYDNLNLGEDGSATIRVSFNAFVDPMSQDGEESYFVIGIAEGTNIEVYKAVTVTTTAQDFEVEVEGYKTGKQIILFDYDGASVCLSNLKVEALLTEGQSAKAVYATVEAEGVGATEAVVPMPYDKVTYRVTAHVALEEGSLKAASEEVEVIRNVDGLQGIELQNASARRYFDLSGRQVDAVQAHDGLYILQDANGATKKLFIK